MPNKRRFLIFLIVLAVMLLIKYAASQETAGDTVGWDQDGPSLEDTIYGTFLSGVICGFMAGSFRILSRYRAARHGLYFTGDLISLQLS